MLLLQDTAASPIHSSYLQFNLALIRCSDVTSPAQVSLKILNKSGSRECNATPHFLTVVPEHVISGIFIPNYFITSMCPLLITFATKFYLRSETYKFNARYHQKKRGFFVCV